MLLADGMRRDVLTREIAAGNLPNVSRNLIGRGSDLTAVTTFPSTTGPAYLPFLTGCFPGTCNVPGIRWFDKSKYDKGYSFSKYRSYVGFESFMMASDVWPHIRTTFELLPNSFSIFNPIARGARGGRNVTCISRIWHWYYGHLTDHWGFTDSNALAKLLKTLDSRPSFVFAVFPAIDEFAHLSNPLHERTIAQYRWLDSAVGRIICALKAKGMWDETVLFIVSDHGLSATHTHFCVNTFLEKRKLPPFFYPLIFKKKGRLSANMVSGNGMTNIYFRNQNGWAGATTRGELEKISPGIIDALINEEAIDIVAVRNEKGGADILSRRGSAVSWLENDKLHYEVKGSDPFGFATLPSVLDSRECLEKTIESNYPDAPFQIAHLLTSPRAGDVVLSATEGFDLRFKYENPPHYSSHGSLHWTHMRVPVISNVPFKIGPIRTVDVFPTVFGLLGAKVPSYIDGVAIQRI